MKVRTETLEKVLRIAGYFAATLVLTLTFLLLDNGITHEEGWMAYLLKVMPSDLSVGMRYPLLFRNVFHDDIYLIRVAWFIMNFVSAMVFAWGLRSFLDRRLGKNNKYLWVLTVVFLGQLAVPDQPMLHYYSLNLIVTEISLGCILAALSGRPRFILTVAGIFNSMLLTIMVPNVVILLFELAFIFVVSNRKILDGALFVLGPVLLLAGYLCVAPSPGHIFEEFWREVVATVNRSEGAYGLAFMVNWSLKGLFYLLCLYVAALCARCFSLFAGRSSKPFLIRYRLVLTLAVLVVVLICIWICTSTRYYDGSIGGRIRDIYWVVLFYMILCGTFDRDRIVIALLVLLSLAPACLSVGTAVPFPNRYGYYLSFITPAIFLLPRIGRHELKYLLIFVLFFAFARKAPFGAKWEGSVWLDQNIPLKTMNIEQNIKVDRATANGLQFCREHIPEGSSVITHKYLWTYVELLDYRSLSSTFAVDGIEWISSLIDRCQDENGVWVMLFLPDQADLLPALRDRYPYSEEYISEEDGMALFHVVGSSIAVLQQISLPLPQNL